MDLSTAAEKNITADSLILYLGVIFNLGVVVHLNKTWVPRNRVQFHVLSLCLTDCLGLVLRQSTEVGLHATVTWATGEAGCKVVMALALAGTFLAHITLVNFNIDNTVTAVSGRSVLRLRVCLLVCAGLITGIGIGGQICLYHIETHPIISSLRQCTTLGRMDPHQEELYHVTGSIAMFWGPALLVFIFGILSLAWRNNASSPRSSEVQNGNFYQRSDWPKRDLWGLPVDVIYVSTLNIVFISCWMPYSIMQLFRATKTFIIFDEDSRSTIWDALSYMSMINHCVNPLVYGVYLMVEGIKTAARASTEVQRLEYL